MSKVSVNLLSNQSVSDIQIDGKAILRVDVPRAKRSQRPVFLNGNPLGGNAFVLFNQEVRFPIFGWVRGVGFIDAGDTYPLIRDMSLSDLAVGTGFGLRVHTPFALVRFDVARSLRPREDERRTRWYISIGQAF